VLAALAAGAFAVGCSKKPEVSGPPPELTGLAAVPASAQAVIGADITKLTDTPLVDRAVDQLLLRNPALSERWGQLKENCKIDFGKQVKRVMLAIGPRTGPDPGTGPVNMVVVGAIPEAELKDCVTRFVGSGGGSVTGKAAFGRTLYLAKDGNRAMYFAYGRPDTVVLGADEAFVTDALGTGKKASDSPELAGLLKQVNQSAPAWAAGRADPRIRDGLVQLTEGKLRAGPVAYTITADPSEGLKLALGVVMASPEDAKNLESYVKGEMALLGVAAQLKSLGPLVAKVAITVENDTVRFHVALTVEDLNLLFSALDGGAQPAQDSAPPSGGSGSAK
jgi:hypothetical protein